MKVVINNCYGGFGISGECVKYLKDKYNIDVDIDYYSDYDKRTSVELIDAIETLGEYRCSDRYAKLKIIECSDGDYVIGEYCGLETLSVFPTANTIPHVHQGCDWVDEYHYNKYYYVYEYDLSNTETHGHAYEKRITEEQALEYSNIIKNYLYGEFCKCSTTNTICRW